MKQQDPMHPDRINEVNAQKFSDMNALEKVTFVGKVILFLVTGGFAFPNIFSD